VVAKQI